MKITIIGMSNSGKTYWSKKLEKIGFVCFCCDEIIERKLGSKLKRLGFSGIEDIAKWLGQPYEEKYQKNSKIYLKYEKEAMEEIIQKIKKIPKRRKLVVDSTGSLIYLSKEIIKKLKKLTSIVYLDTPQSLQKQMYESYLKNPKPVIWGSGFVMKNSQTWRESLVENYPKLLAFRTREYKKWADITADYYLLRSKNFKVLNFLKLL